MVQVGLLLSDVPTSVSPSQQFRDVLRLVEAAQANDFTYIAIGQHFLYGDLRWLQPVPLLARLAAEVGPDVRLVTQIMIAPLYHPVLLAEEIATLDVVTKGRLVYAAVKAGFDARGKAFGPQPLRRNVLVADTREQAVTEYARVAQGRYITYAQRGLDVMADTDLERDFAAAVAGHAVIGTVDDVTKQLLDLVTTLPVDPLLVRPQWPTMDADETIAAISPRGAAVVPAIRAVEPRTSI